MRDDQFRAEIPRDKDEGEEKEQKIPSYTFAVSLFFSSQCARCAPVDRKVMQEGLYNLEAIVFSHPSNERTHTYTDRDSQIVACQTEICSLLVIRDSAESATRDPCGQSRSRGLRTSLLPLSPSLRGLHPSCCRLWRRDILCRASCSCVVSFPVDLARSLSTCYSH